MRKLKLITGSCLLLATLGVYAFSGFETAPKPTSKSDYRMTRTLPAIGNAGYSNAPFTHTDRKVSTKASASGPKIYGLMQYSDSWWNLEEGESYPYGCYEISKANPNPTLYITNPNLKGNGGGCYTNHQIHYRLWEVLTEDPWFNNYYLVVNTDEWYFVQNPVLTHEQGSIANDMTYDPVSKKIYASVWSNFDGGASKLATINAVTGSADEIATIPEMACLAANNFGELYGVELLTGTTYRIDKTTGEYISLGFSGIHPKYMQSACVDPETNIIYWIAALEDDTAGVYTLNTTTGKADLYFSLPNNEEFTCAFIEAPTQGLNAPAALSDFSVAVTGEGSKIKFTAPDKAFDGTSAGTLTVKVYADGNEIYSKNIAAGGSDEFLAQLGDGHHTVVAFAQNGIGEGPKSVVDHFTGNDAPAAPSNVTLSVANNVANLSWDAPTTGLHGGSIETDKLTYNITRYPEGEMVAENLNATTFSETLPDGMANYYYTVTSLIGESVGGTATSNSWFAGQAFEIPYIQTFDDPDSMNGFTILDGDGDGAAWEYSTFWKAAWSKYNKYEQSNNWLITPPIRFEANSTYKISFKACAFDEESPERFEVMFGKTPTMEGMTKTIVPSTITKNTKLETYTAEFTTDAEGVAYIGFHSISQANAYRLIIDDVEIRMTASAGVPAAVSDLKAVPAADGSAKVTISFTTPDKSQDGTPLKSLSAVEIFRNSEITPVYKFDKPTPGAKLEWTDENAPSGDVSYRVVASNENGSGIETTTKAFVGFDTPLPASNLKLVLNDKNELVVSWTPPMKTKNGHDINKEYLSYSIVRNDGTELASNIKTNSFTDSSLKEATEQKMVYYQITTLYGDKESDPAIGDFVIIGDPLQLPFKESFANKQLDNTPWIISRLTGHSNMRWSLQSQATTPDATSQDNDGGFASFLAYNQDSGIMERMTSPKIDLFSADHPVLKFYMYTLNANVNETLTVQISNNDQDFHTLKELRLKGDSDGWKEVTIDIPRKYCTESAMISFLGTSARGFNIHIDNIRIENGDKDLPNYDLEAVSLVVPDLVPDKDAKVVLTVYNNGLNTVDSYKVELFMNGISIIQSNADKAIASGETYQYIFTLTPEQSDLNQTFRFKGKVSSAVDTNPYNDETEEIAAVVRLAGLTEIGINAETMVSVYNLNGVAVMENVLAEELSRLPKGIYLVRNQGMTVKIII